MGLDGEVARALRDAANAIEDPSGYWGGSLNETPSVGYLRQLADRVEGRDGPAKIRLDHEGLRLVMGEIEKDLIKAGYTCDDLVPVDKPCIVCEASIRLRRRLFPDKRDFREPWFAEPQGEGDES